MTLSLPELILMTALIFTPAYLLTFAYFLKEELFTLKPDLQTITLQFGFGIVWMILALMAGDFLMNRGVV